MTDEEKKNYDTFVNLGPAHGDQEWTHDLFNCFDDPRLCIFTFLVPCYTMGRNAEYEDFGESCCLVGLAYCKCCVAIGPLMRWRIRELKNIKGSMMRDILTTWCCSCCALIQESRELYGDAGAHLGEKLPSNISIERN